MIDKYDTRAYHGVLKEICRRLAEPAPAHIQILVGPRQVGKTTLLLEIEDKFRDRAVYVALDGPEVSMPGGWDLLWHRVMDLSEAKRHPVILLLDEVQHLADWSSRLKVLSDEIHRRKRSIHVVASGSSSLLVGRGCRESMAGRFERLVLSHWPVSELARIAQLSLHETAEKALSMGSYPGTVKLWGDLDRCRSYVRDSIVEPAIGKDILLMESVRKPALLRHLFSLGVGHPAEVIALQKLCGMLTEPGALETVSHYLHVLEDAFLLTGLQKYSEKEIRKRSSPPKIIVLNQALLFAMSPESPPDHREDPTRWGRWVENACLAHAVNRGQEVFYWRDQDLEVDGVVRGTWGSWALEVKSGRYGLKDLAGLIEFCRRYPGFRPMVITSGDHRGPAMGIRTIPWVEYLSDDTPLNL